MKKILTLLAALLLAAPSLSARTPEGKHLAVLIAGKPSHPSGAHEFNAGVQLFAKCLAEGAPDLVTKVHLNSEWPSAEELAQADTILIYADGNANHPLAQDGRLAAFEKEMKRGCGFVCAHFAVEIPRESGGAQFLDWLGGFFEINWSVNPTWKANFAELPRHPISNGVKPFASEDEWYFHMRFREGMKGITPILSDLPPATVLGAKDGLRSGNPALRAELAAGVKQHMAWASENAFGGRGFGFTGGHFHQGWGDDEQRKLMLNAILWTAGMQVPEKGVLSRVNTEDLEANLDPKPNSHAKRPAPKRGEDAIVEPFDASKLVSEFVPAEELKVSDGLEVKLWAKSPLLFNPTNMDMDAAGRIWVCEGVNYRKAIPREGGDRIVVVEDTDGDGIADSSHTFVQDPELVCPMGISVFGNKVVVSQPPHILVYTDVNGDGKFDHAIDKREEFLSGFNGRNHDHSLHTVVGGPDGMFYFSQGNCGARMVDRDGRVFQSGGTYYQQGAGHPEWFNDPTEYAGKPSADGRVYAGGFAARVRPDGRGLQIIGDGFRNSYELCVNSLGDIFQNDNDDPPACRNTWLMEGGFFGYFSKDGKRQWQMDRRPGQTVPVAHWRQDDPGSLPAGDVYGSGSPTGVLYYENGALPAEYEGSFLACEARARLIQRYRPQLSKTGAAVELGPRSDFLTCENTMFRPSDAMVGTDGALYVADWFDKGVGGHATNDRTYSGAIYRIAPKGFKRTLPKLTGDEIQDGITLLQNPAPSVRFTGFEKLRRAGASALPAVRKLLAGNNRWFSARAMWLLPHLGPDGLADCRALLTHRDAERRLLAFRALRAAGQDVMSMAKELARDESAAVRREVAVSLRTLDSKDKLPLTVQLFSTASGADRHYLDACGMAAAGMEDDVWRVLDKAQGKTPLEWSDAHAWRTWRLLPKSAVPALIVRAKAKSLQPAAQKQAMETLAFIGTGDAVQAIADLASGEGELASASRWWLINRGMNEWAVFGTRELLKERGIYDPEKVTITPVSVPDFKDPKLPPPEELMKLRGDAVAGKAQAARCVMCHHIDGIGVDYGPDLRNWVSNQGREAFFEAVRTPSAGIALGYSGTAITLKDGSVVEGIVFRKEDPVSIMSTGGLLQYIPADRIATQKPMGAKSLMLSAEQLGLTAQDLADLAAYLQTYTGSSK